MAYSGYLESKRRANHKETMADPMIYAGFEGFDTVYMERLLEEAKIKPKQINPDDFKPKKIIPQTFRDNKEQGIHFFDQHQAYGEKKLE